MKRTLFLMPALLVLGAQLWAAREIPNDMKAPSDAAAVQRGKDLYERKCQWCHGEKGDGKGAAASKVNPRPRDFTKGIYKIRTTQSGEIPTDWDLFRSISKGLPGTTMVGWENVLTEKDRWALVAYIKTFSDRFKNEQVTQEMLLTFHKPGEKGTPYPGDPGKPNAELLKEGDQLFHGQAAKCVMCHGAHGRGNGPSGDTLTDDWNHPIWPANLTKGYDLRGGDSAHDIYRTISNGFSGSPMPAFRGALDADPQKDEHKRWALSYYIKSLQAPRKLGALVKGNPVSGELPAAPQDPRWEKIDWVDIPMAGQVVMNPRLFTPSVDNLSVKACYNEREIAILLAWDDRTKNVAVEKKRFPDQAAIQFPTEIPADPAQSPKPYFAMGDADHPVDIWHWTAETNMAHEMSARGMKQIQHKMAASSVSAKSLYDDGRWTVVFTRPLSTSSKDDVQIKAGVYVPIAFAVWDGYHGERKSRKAISTWYYLLLIPPVSSKVYLAPGVAVVVGVLLQLFAARKARDFSNLG